MNKFEMPKMDIAKFSFEDVITTSTGTTDANIAAAKQAATGELYAAGVEASNIFYFENVTE